MKFIAITICYILSSLSFSSAFGQDPTKDNVWKALSSVTYKITEDEYGELYVPDFSDEAEELEGKVVTVPGYIIPFEGLFKPEHVIVSSLPIASCFFCGSGGPETVMEVFLNEPIDYTEEMVAFRGKLKLNDEDYEQLMYILEDAELIGPVKHDSVGN